MSIEPKLRAKFGEVRKGRGRNGTEYKVRCPYCAKKWKMYINPAFKGGVYNCYVCGKSGPLRDLISDFESEGPAVVFHKEEPLPTDIKTPGKTLPLEVLPDDNIGIQYLTNVRKRPFDPREISKNYGVQFCVEGRQFSVGEATYDTTGTLIFPVWMFDKLVGWQSRLLYTPDLLTDEQLEAMGFGKDEDGDWLLPPKYLTNPGFKKGRVLWNFDVARKWKFVIATEGVFDGMAVGGPATCTFGTGISDAQASLFKNYWEAIIILLDPDGTEAQVQELVGKLRRAITVVPVRLSGGYKDPGDTPTEEIWKQIVATIENKIRVTDTLALRDLRRHIIGG